MHRTIVEKCIHWHHKIKSISLYRFNMMTSSNGNIIRVTDDLREEFIDHQWIPRTNASDAELCCFLWSAPE